MKKVVLIGKQNEMTKKINRYLSPYCQPELCADDMDIITRTLHTTRPSLIIVSLPGITLSYRKLFPLLSNESPTAPVIAIGNRDDETRIDEAGYLSDGRVHFLRRPINLEEIIKCSRKLLHIDTEPIKEKKTILVVDDNPSLLRAMQYMLSKVYKVVFATSGSQAIAVIARRKPDLILLDYEMPVCDGKKTFEMLRSEDETKDIPVVFLTGMADADHVKEVLALKPEAYLLKPPSEERILATIDEVLKEHAKERGRRK